MIDNSVAELESSFSDRLLHPQWTKERYNKFFLPAYAMLEANARSVYSYLLFFSFK